MPYYSIKDQIFKRSGSVLHWRVRICNNVRLAEKSVPWKGYHAMCRHVLVYYTVGSTGS
jgi:hypothetical protein